MLNKVNGVVIRTVDYGEGNKILRLYTEEKGKLSLMARGAKKVKSRHAAVSQLFTLAQYTFFSSGSMGTLNHGEIIRPRSLIREDLVKTAFAALCGRTGGPNRGRAGGESGTVPSAERGDRSDRGRQGPADYRPHF